MNDPYSPPAQPSADTGKPAFSVGKFVLGFFIPFLAGAITLALSFGAIVWAYENRSSSGDEYVVLAMLGMPTLGLLALEVYFLATRKRELAMGVAIGTGLILLLVAACFGLVWLGV